MARPPAPLTLASRLAAVGFGVVAGLLLGEAVLRIAHPEALRPGLEDVEAFVVPDPVLGWVGRPNVRSEARFDPDFRHEVSTNSRGLRNRETAYARDRRRRILCLGDSFTWGLGVESRDAFPSLLEQGLPGTEVVNAGVIGWGTAQEWLWLEREGPRYAPDVLVLEFFVNDFWDNEGSDQPGRRPIFAVRDGAPVLVTTPAPLPAASRGDSVRRFLRLHSLLFRAAELGVGWLRAQIFPRADLTPLARAFRTGTAEHAAPPAQEVTFALLGRIRAFCKERGIRLIVLLVPSHWDVRPALEGTRRGLEFHEAWEIASRFCRTLDVETVDLRPKLVEMERRGVGGFHGVDIHLNAAGHRAAADLLLARLAGR